MFSRVMFGPRDLNSDGVGRSGGHHPTCAFFSSCPPPCLGCGCLLILWQHGDLQGIVASTTPSYDGVTDIVQIAANPVSLV